MTTQTPRISSLVIPDRAATRALQNFVIHPDTWCHISTYSTGSHGYAQIGWSGPEGRGTTTAHRAAWAAINGQIPPGITIDHRCRSQLCVNPSHLRPLTNRQNAQRTHGRDWPLGQCANGHPDSELRAYSEGPGKPPRMRCRICRSKHQIDYKTRNQEPTK